jgi:hypothetical protein
MADGATNGQIMLKPALAPIADTDLERARQYQPT